MKEMIESEKFDRILKLVKKEFEFAITKFGEFHNSHEAYAVLLEEVNELWDRIKQNSQYGFMFEEAIQVAAMAIRFIYDLGDDQNLNRTQSSIGDRLWAIKNSKKALKRLRHNYNTASLDMRDKLGIDIHKKEK